MINHSPRRVFDQQLRHLLDDTLLLGGMAEQAVAASVEALYRRDLEESKKIFLEDQLVNDKRYEMENHVITLIASQQPMARDLRFLAAVLEIITELERIADYAKGISKINLLIGVDDSVSIPVELGQMAHLSSDMLQRALISFVEQDAESARRISGEDEKVDALYNQIHRKMLKCMLEQPQNIDQANYIVWAAHNLERMADRVTNICERILYVVTGEMKELDQNLGIAS